MAVCCTANPTTAIAKAENVSRGETFEGLWAIAISSHLIQLGNQHNAVPNVFGVVDWFDLLGFSLMLFDKIVGAHWYIPDQEQSCPLSSLMSCRSLKCLTHRGKPSMLGCPS